MCCWATALRSERISLPKTARNIWSWRIFPKKAFPFGEGGTAQAVTEEVNTLQHNKNLTERAQELRKNMTKEERRLWYEYLHSYPYRFRRQVTFGTYILDFYCAAAKLAIELDGSQHFEISGQLYDQNRTEYLNSIGIFVLRFSNTDVIRNLTGVCKKIDMVVSERIR